MLVVGLIILWLFLTFAHVAPQGNPIDPCGGYATGWGNEC
jgi:hypothetical protein